MNNRRKLKNKPSLSQRSRSDIDLVVDHIHKFQTETSYDEDGKPIGTHKVCTSKEGCTALRNMKDAPYSGAGAGLNRAARRSRAKD